MDPDAREARLNALVALAHELGREDRKLAILGEGNVSTRVPGGMLVKASGRNLATLSPRGIVECRAAELCAMLGRSGLSDAAIDEQLLASRVRNDDPKPSVEALFHAYLLGLPGVEWVGHAHPVAVNRVMCSPRTHEFARRRIFPDEVVCCGEESVLVPYADPGLKLAEAIRLRVDEHMERRGGPPRVILLASHGVITVGSTSDAVLAAMLMVTKSADIWVGAAALGGPNFLSDADVRRIAGRSDEEYRRRALNL
ncbi:MAG: class II aldolase/adducin family protein [Phycisphaerales bacterium]|nr:class II aldolase/adducin family protein [Phycisphaerales bacterium]